MARARNIKPGFYKNEDLAECSVWARYIFPGLWMLADREGRLEDRPKRIKAELLSFDTQDVEPLLRELSEKKDEQGVPFIVRYQNSDGRFIQISKFSRHQTPHYSEKPSVIKPPTLQEKPPDISGGNSGSNDGTKAEALREDSAKHGVIKRGSQPPDSLIHRFSDSPTADSGFSDSPTVGKPPSADPQADAARTDDAYPEEFEAVWREYPRRHGGNPKRDAFKAWEARRKTGVAEADMLAGVQRYAVHIRASGKEGTEFVMQAVRFFGKGKHYAEPWPARPNGSHQAAIDEAERRIFGGEPEKDITDEARRI